ncbi:MAG: hypothetical protein OEV92_09895, partial [Nitrospinota bacterium]|nr:hypothetical protein [Nitrospinota bacterium]
MEEIIEQEHLKQGKARGSTSLSGQKSRLLAMALLFAVLAGAGFAIGEETDETGQTNNQDAAPEVIQLDGPIQPSAIITKDGVVIPKHNAEKGSENGPSTSQRSERQEKKRGIDREFIENLNKSFPKLKVKLKQKDEVSNKDIAPTEDGMPGFTKNFQISESRSLERQYTLTLHPPTLEDIIRFNNASKPKWGQLAPFNYLIRSFDGKNMKWKYLGKKNVLGASKEVWQTAIHISNAEISAVVVRNTEMPPSSSLLMYGKDIAPSSWARELKPYIVSCEEKNPGGIYNYYGNTVIIEYVSDNRIPNPNQAVLFHINEIVFTPTMSIPEDESLVQFEAKSETKAKPSSPKSYPRNAYTSGDPVYDDNFYSEFQMEDAKKLERKY